MLTNWAGRQLKLVKKKRWGGSIYPMSCVLILFLKMGCKNQCKKMVCHEGGQGMCVDVSRRKYLQKRLLFICLTKSIKKWLISCHFGNFSYAYHITIFRHDLGNIAWIEKLHHEDWKNNWWQTQNKQEHIT